VRESAVGRTAAPAGRKEEKMRSRGFLILAVAAGLLLMCAGCAPGTERFAVSQAGFWAGLWHGLIMIITFVIGLFSDSVRMYEPNNVGALYDLGFLLGAMISLGGCASSRCKNAMVKSRKEREWEDIGIRVEEKVRTGIQNWLDESDSEEGEWEEIAKRVEEKIKSELKDWTDK
jgi:hypothetical protein